MYRERKGEGHDIYYLTIIREKKSVGEISMQHLRKSEVPQKMESNLLDALWRLETGDSSYGQASERKGELMKSQLANKFREETISRSLVEGNWANLTIPEIAEELLTDTETIRTTIHYVKKRSGYIVPYKKRPKHNRMRWYES